MGIKRHIDYTFEHYEQAHDAEHSFPLPFDTDGGPEHVWISESGLRAVLAFLVHDDSPSDPFEGDEGDFYQFNRRHLHDASRPEPEEFRRIIRANPGRVFTVCTSGDGYAIDEGPFTVADTKAWKECPSCGYYHPAKFKGDCRDNANRRRYAVASDEAIEDADGYYIVPADATDPRKYAEGVMSTYSDFCTGDVYGVIVWTYARRSIADPWPEPDREMECWGYYGSDTYTREELESQFRYGIAGNDPSKEQTDRRVL